jgi:hypothetical protein
VLRIVGTPKSLAAFENPTTLLISVCLSMLVTPKSICGWWSIRVMTQLSGVSNPFSLRLERPWVDAITTPFLGATSRLAVPWYQATGQTKYHPQEWSICGDKLKRMNGF